MRDDLVQLDEAAPNSLLELLVLLFRPHAISNLQHIHGVDLLDREGHAVLVSGRDGNLVLLQLLRQLLDANFAGALGVQLLEEVGLLALEHVGVDQLQETLELVEVDALALLEAQARPQ